MKNLNPFREPLVCIPDFSVWFLENCHLEKVLFFLPLAVVRWLIGDMAHLLCAFVSLGTFSAPFSKREP